MEATTTEDLDLRIVAPTLAEDPLILLAIERLVADRPPLSDDTVDLLRRLGCPSLN